MPPPGAATQQPGAGYTPPPAFPSYVPQLPEPPPSRSWIGIAAALAAIAAIAATLAAAHRKWAHGVTVIWYPLKDRETHMRWKQQLRKLGIPKFLVVEHWLYDRDQPDIYNGAGLFIVNPPYAFIQALPPLLEAMRVALAPEGHRGQMSCNWLDG